MEALFNSLFLLAAGMFFHVTSRFMGQRNGALVIFLVLIGLVPL
jgi:hypothetical protein